MSADDAYNGGDPKPETPFEKLCHMMALSLVFTATRGRCVLDLEWKREATRLADSLFGRHSVLVLDRHAENQQAAPAPLPGPGAPIDESGPGTAPSPMPVA